VIQGFACGPLQRFPLARYGVKIIAVSDVQGGIYNPKGLNLGMWKSTMLKIKLFQVLPAQNQLTMKQLLALDCDILVPAPWNDELPTPTPRKFRAAFWLKLPMEPTTPEADEILNQRPEIL
jgi:glutamate dehydrogenase (NAD(P)+)